MRILIIHNEYQIKGGEDSVVRNETELLQAGGDEVFLEIIRNTSINGVVGKILTAIQCVFSISQFFHCRKRIKSIKPDVVHVHNYFPLISPSVFYACSLEGVPVVHTLHNFRAICPTALLMQDGIVTDKSIEKGAWWALRKRVYRDSFVGTLFLILMIEFHKSVGTWERKVDVFVALTDFSKDIYVRAGWPAEKIFVKPNFCQENAVSDLTVSKVYALYVGRISAEKGIDFILDAFAGSGMKLVVVGEGPLQDRFESLNDENVEYLGPQSPEEVRGLMSKASFLVMASTWYEGFPMVIVESLSSALPVVVPRLGNMAAIVGDGYNGLHYIPSDKESLLKASRSLFDNEALRIRLAEGARETYLSKYNREENYMSLLRIYNAMLSGK